LSQPRSASSAAQPASDSIAAQSADHSAEPADHSAAWVQQKNRDDEDMELARTTNEIQNRHPDDPDAAQEISEVAQYLADEHSRVQDARNAAKAATKTWTPNLASPATDNCSNSAKQPVPFCELQPTSLAVKPKAPPPAPTMHRWPKAPPPRTALPFASHPIILDKYTPDEGFEECLSREGVEAFFRQCPATELTDDEVQLLNSLISVSESLQAALPHCVSLQEWAERRIPNGFEEQVNRSGLVFVGLGRADAPRMPSAQAVKPSAAPCGAKPPVKQIVRLRPNT